MEDSKAYPFFPQPKKNPWAASEPKELDPQPVEALGELRNVATPEVSHRAPGAGPSKKNKQRRYWGNQS